MIGSIADIGQRARWKLSIWVNKLPYCGHRLSKLFFTKEELAEINEMGERMAAALKTQAEVIEELKTLSPALRFWVKRENTTAIEGGIYLVNEALVTFTNLYGKERVVEFFERFVKDEWIFRATMRFFFELPQLFRESGYVNQTGVIADEDQDAANQLFVNQLTTTMVHASPERVFEWAELCDQLSVLFHEE